MAPSSRTFSMIAACLFTLAVIFIIVINIVPSWATSGTRDHDYTQGLWQYCSTSSGQTICSAEQCPTPFSGSCATFNAARMFIILASIIAVTLIVVIVINARRSEYGNARMVKTMKYGAVSCLIFIIIGVSCGIHITTTDGSWSAASYLAILSIFITLGGSIAVALIK